jgi:hypothetical protein
LELKRRDSYENGCGSKSGHSEKDEVESCHSHCGIDGCRTAVVDDDCETRTREGEEDMDYCSGVSLTEKRGTSPSLSHCP